MSDHPPDTGHLDPGHAGSGRVAIDHVEIGVADLQRSLDFYRGLLDLRPMDGPGGPGVRWLSAGAVPLKLVAVGERGLDRWVLDDLQRGFRHVGLKVGDTDRYAERVRDAGVPFTIAPMDAVGVRLAFVRDPDGTHVEIIDRHVRYDQVVSDEAAERERLAAASRPRTAEPVFDHVAVTVRELSGALSFYRDTLGYEIIGEVFRDQDPRGLRLTYLSAGTAVLELFSFTEPTLPAPWTPGTSRNGLRHVALSAADPAELTDRMLAAGASHTAEGVLIDPYGLPALPISGAG